MYTHHKIADANGRTAVSNHYTVGIFSNAIISNSLHVYTRRGYLVLGGGGGGDMLHLTVV